MSGGFIMRSRITCLAILALFLTVELPAQSRGTIDLRVRVSAPDGRTAGYKLRVELLSITGIPVADAFTDDTGFVTFPNTRSGGYRLRVTGMGIVETVSDAFRLEPDESAHFEHVTVKREEPKDPQVTGSSTVNLNTLSVPGDAQKSYEKGVEALNREKVDDARKQFEKAIEKHPNYASAYNMLGITFIREKDTKRGQQAFEKSVAIDGNFAPAYTNLAKIHFAQRNMGRCEELLQKSLTIDPRNAETLAILSQVNLMVGNYEQAAINARRVHELPQHKDYAVAHFIAARALRARSLPDDAIVEYKLFLQEAPGSTSAATARDELAALEKQKKP
jgi:Tfp pilus assembly protein PilF